MDASTLLLFVTVLVGMAFLFASLSGTSKSAPHKTVLGKPFRTGTGLDVLAPARKKSALRKNRS